MNHHSPTTMTTATYPPLTTTHSHTVTATALSWPPSLPNQIVVTFSYRHQ
ncbi:hypothetical protein HanXRQr2_Chr16g0737691 [Helianthus annuus]|uniref:Uncharacterized protein n=1 Tax=Helianthus annuus TaxID=4232 RepID=A0A9K3DS37_HELAN|nr:hypothetical protein HanXRQr2_Chr16g0737691 [Helianthus annuus]